MDQKRIAYQMLAQRTGNHFLDALRALPEFKTPVDIGRLRVSVTIPDAGLDLGFVDMDPVNLSDLADITARRAEGLRAKHATTSKPTLRLVGGDR